MEKTHLVLVYGNLMKGFVNNHGLVSDGFVVNTKTVDKFDMVSYGTFPSVVKEPQDGSEGYRIAGEVHKLNDDVFSFLKGVRDHAVWYEPKLVEVDYLDEPVWLFFMVAPIVPPSFDPMENILLEGGVKYWTRTPKYLDMVPKE